MKNLNISIWFQARARRKFTRSCGYNQGFSDGWKMTNIAEEDLVKYQAQYVKGWRQGHADGIEARGRCIRAGVL